MNRVIKGALSDIVAGLQMRSMWTALAAEDVGDATRRTLLGPVWVIFNYLLYAGTFVLIFRDRFDIDNYPAYVLLGLWVWLFISETVSQSVTLFIREESMIKGTVLPVSVYVLRQCMQSVIRAGYTLIGAVGGLLLAGVNPSAAWISVVPAAALIVLTAPATVTLLATCGALLPDTQYVVSNLMRVGMFLTPVFWWHGGMGGLRAAFFYFNPFTHYLEIVRVPILTGEIPITSWQVCLGSTLVLWLAAIPVLGRFQRRIAFVL